MISPVSGSTRGAFSGASSTSVSKATEFCIIFTWFDSPSMRAYSSLVSTRSMARVSDTLLFAAANTATFLVFDILCPYASGPLIFIFYNLFSLWEQKSRSRWSHTNTEITVLICNSSTSASLWTVSKPSGLLKSVSCGKCSRQSMVTRYDSALQPAQNCHRGNRSV